MHIFKFASAAAVLAAATLVTSASADHELTVDLSVPNQVTISATDGVALATVSGSDGTGVYLADFYTTPQTTFLNETLVSGDLTNFLNPSDDSPNLFRNGASDERGLNIFSFSSDDTVDFVAGTQAFIGSATFALEADDYADMLAGNSAGDIYFPADDDGDLGTATIIGAYTVVVPEPASLSLLGLGGLTLLRRRR